MSRYAWPRLTLPVVLMGPAPYGDRGAVEAVLAPHGYLVCFCGAQTYDGVTSAGAPLLACLACHQYIDERRVP